MAATTPTKAKATPTPISPMRQRMLDALQLRGMAPQAHPPIRAAGASRQPSAWRRRANCWPCRRPTLGRRKTPGTS